MNVIHINIAISVHSKRQQCDKISINIPVRNYILNFFVVLVAYDGRIFVGFPICFKYMFQLIFQFYKRTE